MTAAPTAVLLLGWDDISMITPVARTLSEPATAQLWTERPATPEDLPPGVTAHELGGALLPAPPLELTTRSAPAYPYVGSDPSSTPTARYARPAAPYVGSSAETDEQPAKPWPAPAAETNGRPVAQLQRPADLASPAGTPATAGLSTQAVSGTGVNSKVAVPPPFEVSLPTAEPGPAEAAALSYEQVLTVPAETPAAAEQAAADQASVPAPPAEDYAAATPAPTAPPAAHHDNGSAEPDHGPVAEPHPTPTAPAADDSDDLNFRIIQYARQAVRLAYDHPFEVIFAPEWPTWLAGVELRQLTRRPLVLQLAELAAEQADLPGRGWREALERLALTCADRIFVPDAATAARVNQRYHLPVGRTIVLPPAAAPDLRAALVLETPFPA